MTQTKVAPDSPQDIANQLRHAIHLHPPRNVNVMFEAEKAAAGFNQRVAIALTKLFSAMPTFWLILAWIVLWITANATIVHFDPLPWPLLLCLASVPQLPLMIVIMVGQNLLGRQQELQAEEQFNTTMKTFEDIKYIITHLQMQKAEVEQQTQMLRAMLQATGITPEQLAKNSSAAVTESGTPSTGSGNPSTPAGS
ncbi:MAG TPA: DUF1003 domain-containing protein [Ktedonobacteraceae bacterium]|nr:DUF1003 domain-containing protein [Ktedonobacteraceae bacterium]